MNIQLIALGSRMPDWVQQGYEEYAKRFGAAFRISLVEVALAKRGHRPDIAQLLRLEGEQMLKAIPYGAHVVALDVSGSQWSTDDVATALRRWMAAGKDIALLVGGPDGLAPSCKAIARESWGLSRLTFPHALVRIIVAEQLYRAWTLLQRHPYHRS